MLTQSKTARNFLLSVSSAKLNDSGWHLKAGDVFAAGLEGPVHDELNLGVDFKDLEGVSVDVSLALLKRATGFIAALVEEISAC